MPEKKPDFNALPQDSEKYSIIATGKQI